MFKTAVCFGFLTAAALAATPFAVQARMTSALPVKGSAVKAETLPALEERVPGFMIRAKARGGEKVAASLTARDAVALSVRANIGLRVHRAMSGGAHVLRLDKPVPLSAARAIAARLMRGGDIATIEPDRIARPLVEPADPLYLANQWNLKAPTTINAGGANLPNAWNSGFGVSSVVVAVLDTGIRPHVDIASATVLSGYDFVTNFSNFDAPRANDGNGRDANPEDPGDYASSEDFCFDGDVPANNDSSWHGTHVAGIIAAAINGSGIAGIAPDARILPVRVLGSCGGTFSDIIDGMRWAAGIPIPAPGGGTLNNSTPARLLNLSLGARSGACGQTLQNAIDDVIAAGSAIIAATGNDNVIGVPQPANCAGVIAVTAHAIDGDTTDYANIGVETSISAPGGGCGEAVSNRGQCTPVTAPGVPSTVDAGRTTPAAATASEYAAYAGTSMAAPHVAGVAALMLSQNGIPPGSQTAAQLKSYLQAAARPFPATSACVTRPEYAGKCGAGLLDAERSITILDDAPPYFTSVSPNAVVSPGANVDLTGNATAVGSNTIANYQWTQVGGPSVALSNAGTQTASFVAPPTGVLTFRLTATDSGGKSAAATVTIRVNSPPAAAALPTQTVTVGDTLSFTLTASDPDGDAVVFEPVSLPDGASLQPDGTFTWANASPAGTYDVQFAVRDIESASDGTVAIEVRLARSGGGGSMDAASLIGLSLAAAALRLRRWRRWRQSRSAGR